MGSASAQLARLLEPRTATVSLSAGRILVGVAAAGAPAVAGRMLGIDAATARRAATLARMAGARDLAIGSGALVAALRGDAVRAWLLAGAAADLADVVVIGASLVRGPSRGVLGWASVAAAAGAAAVGFAAAARR